MPIALRDRRIVAGMAVAAVAVLTCLNRLAAEDGPAVSANTIGRNQSPGSAVPDLTGTGWFNVDKPLTWEVLRGRPVLVEFWATWCAPCRAQIPNLREAKSLYANKGLVVVGVTREEPIRVRAFLKKLNIDYAVCSGQPLESNSEIQTIPHSVLIDPSGNVAWTGHPERGLARALAALMRPLPSMPMFNYVPGKSTAAFPARPLRAAPFDEGELSAELDRVLTRGADLRPSECSRLFEFYWRNLPADDWEGDAAARLSANRALTNLNLAIGRQSPAIRKSIGEEVLKRLEGSETECENRSWLCHAIRFYFERGDQRVISILKQRLTNERNPLVIATIEGSLEKLDPAWPAAPPSRVMLAIQANNADEKSLRTKLLGRDSEYARFDAYCRAMYRRITSDEDATSLIRDLSADYHRHDSNSDGDLLIRSQILYVLTDDDDLQSRIQASADLKRTVQDALWGIVRQPDADASLRAGALAGMRRIGFDHLNRKEMIDFFDSRLSLESDRLVRLNLQWWKLKLTDPDKLK